MQIRILGLQGATSIDVVRMATTKMSTVDTIAAVSKTKLTVAEQAQLLQEKGLSAVRATMTASVNAMSNADLYAALTKTTLTEAIAAETLAVSGLTTEQIAAIVAASNLTAENLAQLLATSSLTKEQQIEILTKKGLSKADAEAMVAKVASTTATEGATDATKRFTSTTVVAKGAVNGLTAALAANPFILIAAAVAGLVVVLKTFVEAEDKAAEKAKEIAKNSAQIAKTQKDELDKISELIEKYKELAQSDTQNIETREGIKSIQEEITNLVGTQANNLDLVNGKLDDELTKLYEIQNIASSKTVSSLEKAYVDAADATSKYDMHNADWVRDSSLLMFGDKDTLTIDYWGNNKDRDKALKIIDETWKEQGYGTAYTGTTTHDLLGIMWDTYATLEFNSELNSEKRVAALDAAIKSLEDSNDFDYSSNELWKRLVEIRDDWAGESGLFTAQTEAARELLNTLITQEIGSGKNVDSLQEYLDYKQEIIDAVSDNDVIKRAIEDGAISSDFIDTYVGNHFETLVKYDEWCDILNNEEVISGVDTLTKVINSYKHTIGKLKSATDEYNNTGSVSAETYNELIDINKDYADLFDFSNGKISIAADEVDRLVDELIAEYGATLATNGATEAQITQMVALANSLSDVKEKTEDVVDTIQDLADILQDAVDGTEMTVFETWELLENYPELASAITKTTNGYILEEAAVRELIKAKAELLGMEASEARMAARDNLINNANNVDSANNVDKIFADYYNKNGTNIKSFNEYVSAWEDYYGKAATGNWVEGLQEYVEAIISDNSVNNVMNSLIEDMKNPDTLLKTETEENPISNAFDELEAIYSGRLQELDYLTNTYNNAIKSLENQGYDVPASYYEKLKEVEEEKIALLGEELTALTAKFQEAINAGEIKEGSQEFYDMNNAINSVKESIQESNLALQEYSNTIRDLEWKKFDDIQDEIKKITAESDFLLNLLDDKDMFDDKGKLTEHGNAAMGLHGMNYNVYMEQARRYADEITKIEQELASDKYNQDLIDRKDELLELQRESVLAAEEEKQAMIDLVTEGIEAELDALDELIDKYKDSLDSVKDLYDYQNKVSDITSEISTLQKQIIAYENDTSEETKAQIQKLKVDLQEAQEELQQTEYDQFITDQKKLLDNLYDDYETILNRRLDDVSTLITDSVNAINTNATDIKSTLEATASSVGLTLSNKMGTIWTVTDEAKEILTVYSGNFDTATGDLSGKLGTIDGTISSGVTTLGNTLSTIDSDVLSSNTHLSNISSGINSLAGKLASSIAPLINTDNSGNAFNPIGDGNSGNVGAIIGGNNIKENAPNTIYTNPNTQNKDEQTKTESSKAQRPKVVYTFKRTGVLNSQDYSVSGLNNVSAGWDDCTVVIDGQAYKVATYDSEDNSVSNTTKKKLNDLFNGTQPAAGTLAGLDGVVYVVSKDGSWVDFADKNKRSEMTTAFFEKLNAYKNGGLADFTGLAWMDGTKSKPEAVLDAEDTQHLIALRDILAQLASDNVGFGNPLYSSFAPMSYGGNIPNFGEKLAQILNSYGETNIENRFEITIPIEKVEDYNDFVTKLQKDGKFEKMIQAMTIGRINGGSPLDKYKYQWTK